VLQFAAWTLCRISDHRRITLGKKKVGYTADDIDFIAAFIAKHDAWYLIPLESLGNRQNIRVYPSGQKANRGGRFEQYREAWHLLKELEVTEIVLNEKTAQFEEKHATVPALLQTPGPSTPRDHSHRESSRFARDDRLGDDRLEVAWIGSRNDGETLRLRSQRDLGSRQTSNIP